jgi:hypothetical protein
MFEATSSKNPLSERLIKINIQLSHVKLDKMSMILHVRPGKKTLSKNCLKPMSLFSPETYPDPNRNRHLSK